MAAKSPGRRTVKKEAEPKYLCPYCNKGFGVLYVL